MSEGRRPEGTCAQRPCLLGDDPTRIAFRVTTHAARYIARLMSKTLVIAEKPSVGRDLARVLPGSFTKGEGYLEGPEHIVTWAVGHLVGLAAPDEYDPKFKKWRFADLPILPSNFKLVPNDEKSKKQLQSVHRLIRRDEVDLIVNACDAGREGELIFAYLYETAGVKKPVKRLWLNSMTRRAIEQAFGRLRDGAEMETLEAAARSRSSFLSTFVISPGCPSTSRTILAASSSEMRLPPWYRPR